MNKISREEFIERVAKVHGNTYDVSNIVFKTVTENVIIECKKHGEFSITVNKLYNGKGCQKCAKEHAQDYKRLTTDTFVEKATKVHGNKYLYDKVVYGKSNTDKVSIVCLKHGEFKQTPDKHLQGRGCPSCKIATISLARQLAPNGWSHTAWETKGKTSGNFEGFSLYVIRCTGNGETFIKVGKTFTSVGKRFSTTEAMPYKFSIVTQVYYNAYAISKLEEKIHRELKQYQYIPIREFDGRYECFSIDALELALEMAHK